MDFNTRVVLISRCPSFYDEVKIALPGNLKQNHHLLFTIFHISCQKKPQDAQAPIETPVGYTVIELSSIRGMNSPLIIAIKNVKTKLTVPSKGHFDLHLIYLLN